LYDRSLAKLLARAELCVQLAFVDHVWSACYGAPPHGRHRARYGSGRVHLGSACQPIGVRVAGAAGPLPRAGESSWRPPESSRWRAGSSQPNRLGMNHPGWRDDSNGI